MGMAYGGTPGADGRKQYGIGSWFQKRLWIRLRRILLNLPQQLD